MPTPPPLIYWSFPKRLIHTGHCPLILSWRSCIFTQFLPLLIFSFSAFSPFPGIWSFFLFPTLSYTLSHYLPLPEFSFFSHIFLPHCFTFMHFFLIFLLFTCSPFRTVSLYRILPFLRIFLLFTCSPLPHFLLSHVSYIFPHCLTVSLSRISSLFFNFLPFHVASFPYFYSKFSLSTWFLSALSHFLAYLPWTLISLFST